MAFVGRSRIQTTAATKRDLTKLDTGLEALNTAWSAASEEMYKATQGAEQPGPDAGNANAKSDGEVTDVDFEEVKDDKK